MELKLPIRRRIEMIESVGILLAALHEQNSSHCKEILKNLKWNALFFDSSVQQSVLMLTGNVLFQLSYEPHITNEISRCANLVLQVLGVLTE